MTWAHTIRTRRKALGLSQVQLAAEIGVDQASISEWEHGRHSPSDPAKAALVRVLGLDAHLVRTLILAAGEPDLADAARRQAVSA